MTVTAGTQSSSSKRRVLLLPFSLEPPGGCSAVGAWTIQALREHYSLTVLTWVPVNLAAINNAFGTSLSADDATWIETNAHLRRCISALPIPLSLLRLGLNAYRARRLVQRENYDAVVGTMNEVHVGRRCIQYVHYPWASFPRPEVDDRWYQFRPALLAYRAVASRMTGGVESTCGANLTLVNSAWTQRVFEQHYGAASRVVYPPVPGGFPPIPFSERQASFISVGRLSPEKEFEKIIEILAAVRRHRAELHLHIVGHVDNLRYATQVRRHAAPHADWITFHSDLSRPALIQLVAQQRFGIHGMVGEHFGIAPAELQRAGCITFVPSEGGAAEIVGNDERLLYSTVADAVEKISRVMDDSALQSVLHREAKERATLFSEEHFMGAMRETVEGLIEDSM